MIQPAQPEVIMKDVTITCFTCDKNLTIKLKPWDQEKEVTCPDCNGKEAIIRSTF